VRGKNRLGKTIDAEGRERDGETQSHARQPRLGREAGQSSIGVRFSSIRSPSTRIISGIRVKAEGQSLILCVKRSLVHREKPTDRLRAFRYLIGPAHTLTSIS
jgi:hypothetical protein